MGNSAKVSKHRLFQWWGRPQNFFVHAFFSHVCLSVGFLAYDLESNIHGEKTIGWIAIV